MLLTGNSLKVRGINALSVTAEVMDSNIGGNGTVTKGVRKPMCWDSPLACPSSGVEDSIPVISEASRPIPAFLGASPIHFRPEAPKQDSDCVFHFNLPIYDTTICSKMQMRV